LTLVTRTCVRTGCSASAVATLTFNYSQRTVWLVHRSDEPDPSSYDLCADHAERLSVPMGWALTDQRERALFEVTG
jgi:hypothetical protein